MRILNSLSVLRPNVASMGYALFLAINATGAWGGVFPFLPLEFQTPDTMLGFFLAYALVFSLSYLFSVFGVYFLPGPTRRFFVIAASIPYFLSWCFLVAAMYIPTWSHVLVVAGGGLMGVGAAGFFMLWQRLFASQEPGQGNRDLVLGTAYAALIYFSLYLIPHAVTVLLIPLFFLPLFALSVILKSRTINLRQPMFEDIPRKHPSVYREVIRSYWRTAFSIGALAFCCGVMRSFAIEEPTVGVLVNMMSIGASCLAALVVLFLWQVKNIRMNISAAYRFFFPFLISAFLLLPLLSKGFSGAFASLLYAIYSCSIMLMMIQCAQASRDSGINPVFIYGFFGSIVYFLHDIGFVSGVFIDALPITNLPPLAVIALFAVYLLGLMYFIGQGGFSQFRSKHQAKAERIELVSPNTSPPKEANFDLPYARAARKRAQLDDKHQYRDRISKQSIALQQNYHLSTRETEVMELLARGNSVTKIAEELVVSENTIRTHSKRIYAKLAIHKKQELLDLIDIFSPEDIKSTER